MYKIVPAERQKRSNEMITKNRCKPSKKRLTAVIFGTPGWVRTSGLSLRRRPLYPTELRGLIQKLFNFAGLQDSNDSFFRRGALYPIELLARIHALFHFVLCRYRTIVTQFFRSVNVSSGKHSGFCRFFCENRLHRPHSMRYN